jgi:hypothetical protein
MRCRLRQPDQAHSLDSYYRDVVYRRIRASPCRRFLHADSWTWKRSRPDCAPRRRGGYQPFESSVARSGRGSQWRMQSTDGDSTTTTSLGLRPGSIANGRPQCCHLVPEQITGLELPPGLHWNTHSPFRYLRRQWQRSNRSAPPRRSCPYTPPPDPPPN